jgi:segregation and condensation protein A
MLLPRPADDEEEDPRAELVRRLLEYEQIREIASRLSRAEADRARRFGKGYVEPRPQGFQEDTPLETTWDDVMAVALEVELPHPLTRAHRLTTGLVALEEKIQLIIETLRGAAKVEFSKLLEPWRDRMHGVMTLLAGLELSRQRAVTLRQARLFSELWILRRDLEAWANGTVPEVEEGGEPDEDAEPEPGSGAEVRKPGESDPGSHDRGEAT